MAYQLAIDENANLFTYNLEECKLICGLLSGENKMITCMKLSTMEKLYNSLISNVSSYKYPSISTQEEFEKIEPIWWPKEFIYDDYKNMKSYCEQNNKNWRFMLIDIFRHMIAFVVDGFSVKTPWQISIKREPVKKKVVPARKFLNIKELLKMPENFGVESNVTKITKKKVKVYRKIMLRKYNYKKVPYVKLDVININNYITDNQINVTNQTEIIYDEMVKNDFMKCLNLQQNNEEVNSKLLKRSYYHNKIPFSSNLGSKLLNKRKRTIDDDYRLNKINKMEKYLKSLHVDKPVNSLSDTVTYENNTVNDKDAITTTTSSSSPSNNHNKFVFKDVVVNLKRLDKDLLTKYVNLKPTVSINI